MKKNIFIIYVCIYFSANASAQDWERVYYDNFCYIDYPSSKMEIQNTQVKKIFKDILPQNMKGFVVESNIILQQKGLNDKIVNGTIENLKYARVIVDVRENSIGENALYTDISSISNDDKLTLNTNYKQRIQNDMNLQTGMKLKKWHHAKFCKVNGFTAVNIKYERQLNDKPTVLVDMYVFYGKYEYILTLSYRLEDTYYWSSEYEKILSSFKIL